MTNSIDRKESKNRRNLEKLLETAASKSNLSNQDVDLELDYYDYDVTNASAAPGSYLGMDPAFFVWMPPSPMESPHYPKDWNLYPLKIINLSISNFKLKGIVSIK